MAGTSLSSAERRARSIAEVALASVDSGELHRSLLEWLRDDIGFELGSFHGALDGTQFMHASGYDIGPALARQHVYMSELEVAELVPALQGPIVDTDVISSKRRDRLSLYREQLRPSGVTVMTTALWVAPGGAGGGFHLARTGRGARFGSAEMERLTALMPTIRLAAAYGASLFRARRERAGDAFAVWAKRTGLTAAERRVASFVARGLTNREVAKLLDLSTITIRNHLVSVFRKANISTRAELAYVSSTETSELRGADSQEEPPWVKRLLASAASLHRGSS